MKLFKLSAIAAAIAFTSGCGHLSNYEKPETTLPDSLGETADKTLALPASEKDWWASFQDSELENILETALENNSQFQIADQRLYQVRLALTQGKAERYPTVNALAESGRAKSSTNVYGLQSGISNENSLGLNVSYEIDLWGRVSASNRGLVAKYKAQAADHEALRLSISAQVAQTYFGLRALDQMVQIAKNTVQSRKENLQLRERQYELGGLTQLAVRQAEVELSNVEIQLIDLMRQRDAQRHALSVLLGETPAELAARSSAEDGDANFAKAVMPALPNNIDSELLMRRPDILAAEQNLISANANIAAARAALLPKVSLSGFIGLGSKELSDLFESDSETWQVNAGLLAPIFHGGALRAQVKISEAEQEIKLTEYMATIRTAFSESLDALSQRERSHAQLEARHKQVLALRNTLDLAQTRFDSGYSSYLEVLDAQRSLFDAEVAMVNTKLDNISANIQLYKAIGGDWYSEPEDIDE